MLGRVLRSILRGPRNTSRNDSVEVAGRQAVALPPRSAAKLETSRSFSAAAFWGASDPQRFRAALDILADEVPDGLHAADNLVTFGRNNSMFDDEAFVQAWRANVESAVDEAVVWRRYVLACAGFHCVQLDGDFVECGANAGVGVKTVVDYLGGRQFPKQFWAYDLFEHSAEMINHAMPEHGPGLFARVQAKFEGYTQVHVIKGAVPGSLEGNSPERIAYLHIDMNQAPAEVAALDALFDRVVAGGIVILDDYEWLAYRQQKLAEDEWFDRRGYRVMPLPTGQGLVFKR
jgi:O-methyltransferase